MSDSNSTPELTLEITDLSRSGTGVARGEDGRVVFVPFTAPGDVVKVKLTKVDKRYAQAEMIEIVRPSPQRQTPPCPVFGKCGGCQWQHIPYEMQWATKFKGVLQALTRVQVEVPKQVEELPAEKIWNYRNRIQLRGFRSELGFYAAKSHDRVAIDSCAIARPELNAILAETKEAGSKYEVPYKVELEVLADGSTRSVWNSSHGAGGFRQVHDEQNEKLKAWVSSSVTPGRHVYDLYGGSGNLGKAVAAQSLAVDCVDVGAPQGSIVEGFPQIRFHQSSVAKWISNEARGQQKGVTPSQPQNPQNVAGNSSGSFRDSSANSSLKSSRGPSEPRSAILDPPREGLGEDHEKISAALEALNVQEIIAVGCEPDAWARDVSRWIKRGWKLERVAVLDLFPQTPHIESLALLKV
jgi:23S rRNA (uracil1939-C5)-methyltransferase